MTSSPVIVHHGDNRDVLRLLPDNSVDAVITDPPYALVSIQKRFGKAGSAPPSSEGASGVYGRAASGFMGRGWDTGEVAFAVEFWAEVWRVLKPGGHVAAFSASRTYHRLGVAIEDAGFEIRDGLIEIVAPDAYVEAFAASLTPGQRSLFWRMLDESTFGGLLGWVYGSGFPKSHDVARGIDAMDRTEAARARALEFTAWVRSTGLTAADIDRITGTNMGGHYTTQASQPAVATADLFDLLRPHVGSVPARIEELVRQRTVESENLKARKVVGTHDKEAQAACWRADYAGGAVREPGQITEPLTPDAQKWEGWGTALAPAFEPIILARKPLEGTVAANVLRWGVGALNVDGCSVPAWDNEEGRWPANVILDGSAGVARAFPGEGPETAARFFYSAKADAFDRMGSDHPTVKPVDLMAWLVRLLTPPGALVLDPFAGSGSTGLGAMAEGRRAILIEREPDHYEDILRKVAHARGEGDLTKREILRRKLKKEPKLVKGLDGSGLPLFGGEGEG